MHVNPLKLYATKVLNDGSPVTKEEPMSYVDAAKVAIILAIAGFFTAFLPSFSYEQIVADVGIFVFNMARYIGSTFFTYFIALAGLSRWTAKKE